MNGKERIGGTTLLLWNQLVIGCLSLYAIYRDGVIGRNILDTIISISLNILVFGIELENRKNNRILRQFIYIIIGSTFYLHYKNIFEFNSYLLFGIMIILQFCIFQFLLSYLLQNIYVKKIQVLRWGVVGYLTVFLSAYFFSRKLYLELYWVLQTVFYFLPILVLIINWKSIQRYGFVLIARFLPIVILTLFILTEKIVLKLFHVYIEHNLDFDLYLMLLLWVLSYMLFQDMRIKFIDLWLPRRWNLPGIRISVFLILCSLLVCILEGSVAAGAACLAGLLILEGSAISEIHFQEEKIRSGEVLEVQKEERILLNMIQIRNEQETFEQLAEFLHDDILQDILFVRNAREFPGSEQAVQQTLDRMIRNIRDRMDHYVPLLPDGVPLKKIYSNVIDTVRRRYSDQCLLVDFYCDEELFLLAPYNILVYRAMKEFLNNVYKHAEAEAVSITLKMHEKTISLVVKNDGKIIKPDNLAQIKGRGELKFIVRDVKRLGGVLEITSEETKGTCVTMNIPIKEEIVYENFINR